MSKCYELCGLGGADTTDSDCCNVTREEIVPGKIILNKQQEREVIGRIKTLGDKLRGCDIELLTKFGERTKMYRGKIIGLKGAILTIRDEFDNKPKYIDLSRGFTKYGKLGMASIEIARDDYI